jgi:hypothetical protein
MPGRDGGEIDRGLAHLDGTEFCSFLLHGLPDDFREGHDRLDEYAEEYLQSAGSASRMSLELRRLEPDGYAQYAIGRECPDDASPVLGEEISWAGHTLRLRSCEVFDASSAAPAYHHYRLHDGALPPDVTLRRLDLH